MSADLTAAQIIDRAHRFLREKRDAENLALLEQAAERFPEDPEIRLLLATALVPFRPEEARWQAATAVQLDADNPWRLKRAASLLFHLGEVDAAYSYAARASQLAREDHLLEVELANLGGRIAARRGQLALAEEALRLAVELDPDEEAFARDLAKFLADTDRGAEALEVIDRAVESVGQKDNLERLRESLTSAP